MRISDWSSDVCSSDLHQHDRSGEYPGLERMADRDRRADPGHLDETRPVAAPPSAEQVIAAKTPITIHHDDHQREHDHIGEHAADPGPEDAERRHTELAENDGLVEKDVSEHADDANEKRTQR